MKACSVMGVGDDLVGDGPVVERAERSKENQRSSKTEEVMQIFQLLQSIY
jgi:hypothetical protein